MLQVTIPAGIDEGHQIRLSGEGEVGPRGGAPGSLYFAVHVSPHPTLKREGTELYFEASVSIAQAALGTTLLVPTVEGEEEVEIKPGTQPGTEIRLRGKGVPHVRRSGVRSVRMRSVASSGPVPRRASGVLMASKPLSSVTPTRAPPATRTSAPSTAPRLLTSLTHTTVFGALVEM